MLSPRAVKKFKQRALDSFDFMKKLPRKRLLRMLRDLDPQPEFISPDPMWDHQIAAFLIGIYMPNFLFFLDMGSGKTRVILELIAYRKMCGETEAAAVITVDDTNVENWVMEVEAHCPDLEVVPLYGSTADRLELLEQPADLFVMHYAAARTICSVLKASKKKGKNRERKLNQSRVKKVASKLNMICLDECTAIMHHSSLTYRACMALGRRVQYRYGLAAIPHGRDPTALWSQFHFCDHGETLGPNLGIFRQAFFRKSTNVWSGFPKWTFDKRNAKHINRIIKHRSITYHEHEFRGVPKTTHKPIWVPFTDDMKAYYNRIIDQLKNKQSDKRLARNSFMHMRQIASGFIGLIDDETGERAQVEFPHNPKMEALRGIIHEMDPDRRFLIYHEYNWTGARICEELEELKLTFRRLKGGQKKGTNPAILRQFRKDESIDGLVINNRCGAYGLNLQTASMEIFIETPVSPIDRAQAEMRLRPALNPWRCIYLDVMMRNNSAEDTIRKYLKEGKDLEAAIMRGKRVFNLRRV